jgi:ATP/ADP translocase
MFSKSITMRSVTFRKYVEITTVVRTHAHELWQGALLGTYLFLLVTSTVIGKAVRDALFLSHFTTLQMTYADLQTVVAIGVTMGMYFRLRRSLALRRMLISSSVFFAVGDAACWWAATSHRGWLIRAIYYWVGTQAAITLPQVSMLARQVLTTRQAKRAFGLIGTGAIFGWIVGGLVTRAAAGRVGTEALLLVMAALTAASPMLIPGIWRTGETCGLDVQRADQSAPTQGLLQSATLVWSSPHLRTVALLVLLSSVVTTIAGLQFKAIASQSIGATDRLAAFLGSFSFHAGLVSLAVQILCTSRILQYFGVGMALVVAPLALATGSVGVLVWGTLSTAVFLKGSDHVLRHSIDRAALDLLYVPLSADETLQAKTFIDAVVYRVGDGVGALAVAFGATVLHLSFPSLSVISLGFLAAWIGVAMQARLGYVERLLSTLRQRRDGANPSWCKSGVATRTTMRSAGKARPASAKASARSRRSSRLQECPANEGGRPRISGITTIATSRATSCERSVRQCVRNRNRRVVVHAGSSETGRVLLESLFDANQTTRLEILRALNAFHACHPDERAEAGPLITALAAEIVGLYRLFETSLPTRSEVSATRDYKESIERICRLLKLISPEHDPVSAFDALQSGDARLKANALEYLENILKPQYRRLLVPLLELER